MFNVSKRVNAKKRRAQIQSFVFWAFFVTGKKYLCLEEARKVNFLIIITLIKIMEKGFLPNPFP